MVMTGDVAPGLRCGASGASPVVGSGHLSAGTTMRPSGDGQSRLVPGSVGPKLFSFGEEIFLFTMVYGRYIHTCFALQTYKPIDD